MRRIQTFLMLAIFAAVAAMANPTVRYVRSGMNGDGTSWQSASGDLQAMIEQSSAGDEVWIAVGTYKPDSLIRKNRKNSYTFFLKEGVSLYGGFAGTETDKSERQMGESGKKYDFVHETILSGDDEEPDTWIREMMNGSTYRYGWRTEGDVIPGTKNNHNHILYSAQQFSHLTVIDGLTLKGGNASVHNVKAAGGALYALGNIRMRACRIVENSAWFAAESTSNSDTKGGAVFLEGSGEASIEDCYFARNYSHSSYGRGLGGAIYAQNVVINGCDFEDCVALDNGGAIYNIGGTVKNCTFADCYSASGGAVYNGEEGTFTHNTVYDCRALLGGGVYNEGTASYNIIAGCYADTEEYGNDLAGQGGGVYNKKGLILGSVVYNNKAGKGGGVFVVDGKVVNSTIQNNAVRIESTTINIGLNEGVSEETTVFNTIGNADAEASNFVKPTIFRGLATQEGDKVALREASWALAEGSSFIDAGVLTDGINEEVDIAGNKRVLGEAIDKGAYEHVAPEKPNIVISYAKAGESVKIGTGGTDDTTFRIDWGDGNLVEYTGAKYVTNTTLSETVKIYGSNLLILVATEQGITGLDVTNAPKLSRIQVGGNEISMLDVSRNEMLTGLYCEKNKLDTLDVARCKSLRVLDCSENMIEGAIDCSQMEKLSKVDCSKNRIARLLLPQHSVLYEVKCSDNLIGQLSLSGLSGLNELDCSNNALTGLDLKDLTSVESVYIFGNKMENIDVSACKQMKTLNASNNRLKSVDLSQNTNLEGLYLYDNVIESIDIIKNTSIKWLNVQNNRLTALNTSAQAGLSLLIANNNLIESVDLSSNPSLSQIQLGTNKLAEMNVSKQKSLSWLKVDNNQIASLDLSENGYLYWLECGNNRLAELDLTHNPTLQRLEAENNRLTSLNLSKNKGLEGVLIQYNLMGTEALQAVIESLKDVSEVEITDNNRTWGRQLNISYMPGTERTDTEPAKAKGWVVTADFTSAVGETVSESCIRTREYYTLDGQKMVSSRSLPQGIYLVRETNANGLSTIRKVMVK